METTLVLQTTFQAPRWVPHSAVRLPLAYPDFVHYSARLTAVTVEGTGYTELFELAMPLGD